MKKFKSSNAPKGSKLASGYEDRTLLRQSASGDGADTEARLQALEEAMKLGQIDMDTFERLRREIGVGGDVGSTHLVKGLDWDLLKRVKMGGDLDKKEDDEKLAERKVEGENESGGAEDEFEKLLDEKEKEEIKPVERETRVKKGTMAQPPPTSGKKMTRDEILKQLKASRAAAKASPQPPAETPESTLGSRFKKVVDANKKRWVETDADGRRKEILQITDAQGKIKRKARWLDKPVQQQVVNGDLLPLDKGVKPLGMEVPAEVLARMKAAEEEEEEEDDNIFQGIGDDYNPLAGIDDGSLSSESEEGETKEATKAPIRTAPEGDGAVKQPTGPKNYFATGTTTEEPTKSTDRTNPLTSDPTLLAALKRAAAIRKSSPSAEGADDINENGDNQRHKKFLEEARRREMQDSMDMDMGFGENRFGDEEDEEVWEDRKVSNKRKRGPKKKKGDKDSAADVMKVLEGRKGEKKS